MISGRVIFVFDDDFVGPGRELRDLKPEVLDAAFAAHLVIHHGRVLKNRLGRCGEVGDPSVLRDPRAAA